MYSRGSSGSSGGMGCLILMIAVVVLICYFFIYIVLPSTAIAIAGIAIAGALSGIWVAASNTVKVLFEAHKAVR